MGFNSTIITKKKQLKCGCFDYAFSKGLCKTHATILSTKKRQALANDAPKVRKIAQTEQDMDLAKKIGSANAELERWFQDRRKEMVGYCEHCGCVSEKNSDKYYKYSIAHLLPKNNFKSIATHPDNWIELCYHYSSCHTNFDTHFIDIIDLNCFELVIKKFARMYPSIALEERRRIPPILIEYLKTEI